MLNVQKNIASKMQNLAMDILGIRDNLITVVQMYSTESMTTLTDADYGELADFSNITVAEMTAAKNALEAIYTAIGDFSAGTNATKLLKIVSAVP